MAKRTYSCEQQLDPTILATRSHATQLSGLGDDMRTLLLILNSVEQYDPTHPSPSVVKKARTFKIVPVHFRVSGTALEIAAEEIKNPRECSAYARNDFNIVDADATWVDDGETGAHGEKPPKVPAS
ncbi:hypothetical protein GGP41_002967 [Bipolaris sorokiniana]|uniref:Uncharacterized protein n=1 Tax=Cochliobolus sativus TaxID=45130 RepID=A0A8H6DT39_COCSA|nr:hypothetical protein GGP41_002967 [Bipolaris sorokiniana]